MHYLLDGSHVVIDDNTPAVLRPLLKSASAMMRAATIATMPQYMRDMAGIRQSAVVDQAIVAPMRAAMRALATSRLALAVVDIIPPSTRPIIEPTLLGIPPLRPETLTPREAQAKYGNGTPEELHQRILKGEPRAAGSDG